MTLQSSKNGSKINLAINAANLSGGPVGIANYAWHLTAMLRKQAPELDITLLHPPQLKDYFASLPGIRLVSMPAAKSQFSRVLLTQLLVPWHARKSSLLHSVANYGVLLRRRPQTIMIQDVYEKVSHDRFGALKRTFLSWLVSVTGRRACVILTSSENNRRDIDRYYPHLSRKIRVTPLGTKFTTDWSALERSRKGFLFVGTIEPGKRVSDILEAFARISQKYPEHPLRIVGPNGWGDTDLAQRAKELGLDYSVQFTGYVSNDTLRQLYLDSLALVSASSYEGFGLPVVEAMACGCPVIVAHNSALAEVGEGAADFFPTGDVIALSEAMEKMILDSTHAVEASRKSLSRSEAYTWEGTAASSLKAFEPYLKLPH